MQLFSADTTIFLKNLKNILPLKTWKNCPQKFHKNVSLRDFYILTLTIRPIKDIPWLPNNWNHHIYRPYLLVLFMVRNFWPLTCWRNSRNSFVSACEHYLCHLLNLSVFCDPIFYDKSYQIARVSIFKGVL
jgi:hypothetical protein